MWKKKDSISLGEFSCSFPIKNLPLALRASFIGMMEKLGGRDWSEALYSDVGLQTAIEISSRRKLNLKYKPNFNFCNP